MQLVIFDDHSLNLFHPISLTKSLGDIPVGKYSQIERFKLLLNIEKAFISTHDSLKGLYDESEKKASIWVNARVVPTDKLVQAIKELTPNTALIQDQTILAAKTDSNLLNDFKESVLVSDYLVMENVTDIFSYASHFIAFDFEHSQVNKPTLLNYQLLFGEIENLSVCSSAKLFNCTLNTTDGPIIIDSEAEIQEGSNIRGPVYIGKKVQVKMGARISGGTSIGAECRVGGEISNVVMLPYSNKGHDGFIGNSVIGSWVNLGADTNASNLKNNYGEIKLKQEFNTDELETKRQFCGPMIGDHAKTGINTMLNTGAYVGVAANIFQASFPEKCVKSFTWGNNQTVHDFQKAIETAERMMSRRGKSLSIAEKSILEHIFNSSVSNK
ncbi:MAG: putative sugar nucleotidyl transferase [Bacteroidota bacterium]